MTNTTNTHSPELISALSGFIEMAYACGNGGYYKQTEVDSIYCFLNNVADPKAEAASICRTRREMYQFPMFTYEGEDF